MPIRAEDKVAHDRTHQLFKFLSELNKLGNPPCARIEEQPWRLWLHELPNHPDIQLGVRAANAGDAQGVAAESEVGEPEDDVVLRVRRATTTSAPPPPESLADWVTPTWQRIEGPVEYLPSRNELDRDGQSVTIRFEANARRPELFEEWKARWDEWVLAERPARAALQVFERLYALYGQIEREAERVELYIGDGILEWPRPEGSISHPILIQRLQLEFDPQVPEFILRDTAHPIDLYSALLRTIKEVEGPTLRKCREEVQAGDFHPLEEESTAGFLQRMIQAMHPQGQLVKGRRQSSSGAPYIRRDPVIFLQNRSLGFATAFEAILEQLEQGVAEIPRSLLSIIGLETIPDGEDSTPEQPTRTFANEAEEILFTKSANPEQLQIAERLERSGSVLVQGPPGTGKTHTIANLIGHLLSTNQTVLVTSHTTKALRVLRDQIVENLRPLCVSVLESDSKAQEQLKSAVEGIVQRLSDSNSDRLKREAQSLRSQRLSLLGKIKEVRQDLQRARSDEYRDIVIDGDAIAPSEAARLVAQGVGEDDWVPGPLSPGAPCPLNSGELLELYQSNVDLRPEDEVELGLELPDVSTLPTPGSFAALVSDRRALEQQDNRLADLWVDATPTEVIVQCPSCQARWRVPIGRHKSAKCGKCSTLMPLPLISSAGSESAESRIRKLQELRERCLKAAQVVADAESQKWRLAAVTAGERGGKEVELWTKLTEMIQAVVEKAATAQEALIAFDPCLDESTELVKQISILKEIEEHLGRGKRLKGWSMLFKGEWKRLLATVKVNGGEPESLEHVQALRAAAELRIMRDELVRRWGRQMVPLGAPQLDGVGESVEVACGQFSQWINDCLSWAKVTWQPIHEELKLAGLNWTRLMEGVPARLDQFGDMLRLKDAVTNHLPHAIDACIRRIKLGIIEQKLVAITDALDRVGPAEKTAAIARQLRESVVSRAPDRYQAAYQQLSQINRLNAIWRRRVELLRKLEPVAPAWAAAIRTRQGTHGLAMLPGDSKKAWRWRQLEQEIDARCRVSIAELHDRLASYQRDLIRITSDLVDREAWAAQIARTNLQQRQALMGWLQTIRRIGRGTGRRVPQLRAEARQLMASSRTAVPVWIMPLSRVVENFAPKPGLFDVVIIDEASQSSVLEVIAFYLGKKVIVVGDHEQVSPDAVGQNQDEVKHLIDEYLKGIPNCHLYEKQLSIYDLAMQSFQGTICLREHFRCVPSIIQFSNYLSYQGQIKPLRDATGLPTYPHTVAHRVEGAITGRKTNDVEAVSVASLIAAAIEQPEYNGKSFGVISLVGDEQAYLIDEILRKRLTPAEYESRRIMCGNSAQFQGDERDVMFLSMVDAPSDGPLALRSQLKFQQRYNVAASRARDQMWVVYSLNHEADLKPDDLRRRLISHAIDPSAITRQIEAAANRAESEFERLVCERLVQEGFRVVPQWKVGYYRIDMVVVGSSAKLAIECDGDRFHPPERLEEDMLRQAILERMGWSFHRIRGSEFFRDQEVTFARLFTALERKGIERLGAEASATNQCESNELIERVRRRAAEIARGWGSEVK